MAHSQEHCSEPILPSPNLAGQKMQDYRRTNGLSCRALGERYDLSAVTISRFERGMRWPHFRLAKRFQDDGICMVNDWVAPMEFFRQKPGGRVHVSPS